MKLDWLSIFYLLGGLQALLLVIGINLNKPLQTDLKKILTLLLTCVIVVTIYYIVIRNEFLGFYPYVDSAGTVAWMAICPLYYLLHCCLLQPKWQLQWKHLLFFPVSIVFLLEGWLVGLGLATDLYTLLNRPQLFLDLWTAVFFSTSIFFVLKSIQLLGKNEALSFRKTLFRLSYLLLGILLIYWLVYLFIRQHYEYAFEYTLIALFELIIFAVIYRIFKLTSFQKIFNPIKYVNYEDNKERLEKMAEQLEVIMDNEQLYLDKKLTLSKLSEMTKMKENELSQLFNVHFQSNFYAYLNRKRLDHFEQCLLSADYQQFKIIAIAEMSGFNSKTPLYKVFKERHNMTPSAYLKQYGPASQ